MARRDDRRLLGVLGVLAALLAVVGLWPLGRGQRGACSPGPVTEAAPTPAPAALASANPAARTPDELASTEPPPATAGSEATTSRTEKPPAEADAASPIPATTAPAAPSRGEDRARTPLLVKLSARTPGLEKLRAGGSFGAAVVELDDLDGDGSRELAIGAPDEDEGAGALYVLFLDREERVRRLARLAPRSGDVPPVASTGTGFGATLAAIGDVDGDGRGELATAQVFDDPADPLHPAAVWIFFLDEEARVRAHRLVEPGTWMHADRARRGPVVLGSQAPSTNRGPWFIVATPYADFMHEDAGFLWTFELQGGGALPLVGYPPTFHHESTSFSRQHGRAALLVDVAGTGSEPIFGFDHDGGLVGHHQGPLHFEAGDEPQDPAFGSSLAWLGDQDGDGSHELASGMWSADQAQGGFWVMSLRPTEPGTGTAGELAALATRLVTEGRGFDGRLSAGDRFGAALADLADRGGDGRIDLAAGAPGDDDGGENTGAVWLLALEP